MSSEAALSSRLKVSALPLLSVICLGKVQETLQDAVLEQPDADVGYVSSNLDPV